MYLWLLYASDSALDNETSKFDGDICGYWKHVSMMVDSDAQKKYAHLSFVGKVWYGIVEFNVPLDTV